MRRGIAIAAAALVVVCSGCALVDLPDVRLSGPPIAQTPTAAAVNDDAPCSPQRTAVAMSTSTQAVTLQPIAYAIGAGGHAAWTDPQTDPETSVTWGPDVEVTALTALAPQSEWIDAFVRAAIEQHRAPAGWGSPASVGDDFAVSHDFGSTKAKRVRAVIARALAVQYDMTCDGHRYLGTISAPDLGKVSRFDLPCRAQRPDDGDDVAFVLSLCSQYSF
jgi:hypothetical protein